MMPVRQPDPKEPERLVDSAIERRATIACIPTKATFITLREAAARLGVHENTVRRYADRGLISAVRLPSGIRRLRSADIESLARAVEAERAAEGEVASVAQPGKSAQTLAAEQNVAPLTDVEDLAAPGLWRSDEELDEFIALTRAERDRDR
jgi:excisionase family DNA binding protein